MSAPLIGISGRSQSAAQLNLVPEVLKDLQVDLYFCDYARAVLAAGGLPVYLPSHADPTAYAERLDGLLLSGGSDVDPGRYGHESESDMFPPEPARDEFELRLLDGAARTGIPVLGICRGIQIINVFGGGTLHQHVASHARFDLATNTTVHEVAFTPGSTAAEIYGPSREVNSLHHQTLDEIAAGFRATGHAGDGTVEAIEADEQSWLAVQWHPEMMNERDRDPVFAWLVQNSSR